VSVDQILGMGLEGRYSYYMLIMTKSKQISQWVYIENVCTYT
jgi:hypothetical protein